MSRRCPLCLWALYDGARCQNDQCIRFGTIVRDAVILTNAEALKRLHDHSPSADHPGRRRARPVRDQAGPVASRMGKRSARPGAAAPDSAAPRGTSRQNRSASARVTSAR